MQSEGQPDGYLPASIVLVAVVVVTLALATPPLTAFAYSLDTDRSLGNSFQAGSFDGSLTEVGPATENSTTDESGVDQVRDTWEDYSHTNGTTDPVNNSLNISNTNTTYAVQAVNITLTYTENDSSLLDNGNAQTTASTMNISTIQYNGTEYTVDDANGNGRHDIDDLSQTTVTLGGIPANETNTVTISISGDASQDGGIGGSDGIDFVLEISLVVDPSWTDTNKSTQNTIQYAE